MRDLSHIKPMDFTRITAYLQSCNLSDQSLRYRKVAPKKILENACRRETRKWSSHTSAIYIIINGIDKQNTNYVRRYQPFENYWSWRVNQGQRRMRMESGRRRARDKPYRDHYALMLRQGRGFTAEETEGIRTIGLWNIDPHPFPWLLLWLAIIAICAASDHSFVEFLSWGIGLPIGVILYKIFKPIIIARWERWRSPWEEVASDDDDWDAGDDDDGEVPSPPAKIVVPAILRFNVNPLPEEVTRI